MRRMAFVLTAMALALLLASGVALALKKVGTNGPNTLRGTNGADNLSGRGGNDDLFGLGGRDNLLGGTGKDVVLGGNERRAFAGAKNLEGGRGNDVVLGGLDSDDVSGGAGNDLLSDGDERGAPSEDDLSGGAGTDVIFVANVPPFEDLVTCGGGSDWVWADRQDVVAPDCERVFVGLDSAEEFDESIPQSFVEGLPPFPF
jgi:Ca2+-binding RTX toxin-like protein